MNVGSGKTGGPPRHDKSANAVLGLRPDDGDVGNRTVGDPHLRPIENPIVAVAPRKGAHAGGVAAEIGFGQAETTDQLASSHRWQQAALLLLIAETIDR